MTLPNNSQQIISNLHLQSWRSISSWKLLLFNYPMTENILHGYSIKVNIYRKLLVFLIPAALLCSSDKVLLILHVQFKCWRTTWKPLNLLRVLSHPLTFYIQESQTHINCTVSVSALCFPCYCPSQTWVLNWWFSQGKKSHQILLLFLKRIKNFQQNKWERHKAQKKKINGINWTPWRFQSTQLKVSQWTNTRLRKQELPLPPSLFMWFPITYPPYEGSANCSHRPNPTCHLVL